MSRRSIFRLVARQKTVGYPLTVSRKRGPGFLQLPVPVTQKLQSFSIFPEYRVIGAGKQKPASLTGQSVELLEIRPQWDDPAIIHRRPFAKATYVKVQDCWKVSWMRASLKWQGYEPTPAVPSIDEFLAVVDQDQYGCFWG